MDIIGKKYYYFALSLLIIIPGIIALTIWGLRLSIDFTGGSRATYEIANIKNQKSNIEIARKLLSEGIEVGSIQPSGQNLYVIRTKPLDQNKHKKLQQVMAANFQGSKEISFETIGPTIGGETTANAIKAVLISCLLIVLYIAWSFRKVPKPASGWRFGVCAVIALAHDVLVITGVFAILGYFFNVEIDSLFVTAVLTIIGFSVHDTIVVFDRIRENLLRNPSQNFEITANDSILQTLGRSLNTSLTVLLVLFTLLLFGGESIRWFVVALLIGVTSGTYSSIFNAAPLLVVWEEWNRKKLKNQVLRGRGG